MKNQKKKTSVVPLKKKVVLDLNQYHNSETGELLSSEKSTGATITVMENTDMSKVKYEEFALVSKEAFDYLREVLNMSDIGNVVALAMCAKTELSLLYNTNNVLHSNKTLQEYLAFSSETTYYSFIKRLIKASVLYQVKGNIQGSVRTVYILNPFLMKKRDTFKNQILELFDKTLIAKK